MLKIFNLKDAPQHLEMLAQWHHEQWSNLNPGETLEQRILRMQPYLHYGLIPTTFIAVEDQLLGSAALVENDMETKPQLSPWLASVFVAPPYRHKGIGSQLVSYAMSQAKSGGIRTLYLFTPDMEKFYYKLGWRLISHEKYQGHDVSIMAVDLNGLEI